ncbi:hypothetical protein PMAYCL1PPCAC_00389, partial [Pristionchus mayeri]
QIRLLCGEDDYTGPLVANLYDSNYVLFGGDRKILARDHDMVKGKLITITDMRDSCWFNHPYITFVTLCKKSDGFNVFRSYH